MVSIQRRGRWSRGAPRPRPLFLPFFLPRLLPLLGDRRFRQSQARQSQERQSRIPRSRIRGRAAATQLLPAGQAGFLLPVAFGVSLLLLLGSLSLQTVVLQARLGLRLQEERGLQEDALAAAAQQLVAAINRDHPCLLSLPLERWSQEGLACASAGQQQALTRGVSAEARWQLVGWEPLAERVQAVIDLEPARTAVGRRGRFVAGLLGTPLRAQAPGPLAPSGVRP